MSKINRGIVVSYSLNKDYFQVGSAYQIHIDTNVYRTAVLVKCTDSKLQFKVFNGKDDMYDLTLTLDDIQFARYEITKLVQDYRNGQLTD